MNGEGEVSVQNPEIKGSESGWSGSARERKHGWGRDTGAAWMQQVHQFDQRQEQDVTLQRPLGAIEESLECHPH